MKYIPFDRKWHDPNHEMPDNCILVNICFSAGSRTFYDICMYQGFGFFASDTLMQLSKNGVIAAITHWQAFATPNGNPVGCNYMELESK